MDELNLNNYLPERKSQALKRAWDRAGKSFEEAMYAFLEREYEELVPQSERERIERELARDNAERQKDKEGYCIVQLHEGNDDCYFLMDSGENAYTIASSYEHYCNGVEREYTLDTLAQNFGEVDYLAEKVFESLARAMAVDDKIRAAMCYDFKESRLHICDNQKGDWKVYDLETVGNAVEVAERDGGLSTFQRLQIFKESLQGQELTEEDLHPFVVRQ